jgi:NAD(P)-dependent dehydrogenase (short-subunit alcohol dehydrogenase family)
MIIFSISGHYDVSAPGFHMYSATKHAVTALTEGLRKELVFQQSKIRVTVNTIAPWNKPN